MDYSALANALKPFIVGWRSTPALGDVYTVINVVDHGADKTGATDASAKIQAALAKLKPRGGTLYFPPGTYRLNTGLTIDLINFTGGPVELVGYGATLNYTGAGRAIEIQTNCSGLVGSDAYQYAERSAHLRGLSIVGTSSATAGVYLAGATHCSIRDCFLSGFTNSAAGAGSIVLWGDYYHWTEQTVIDSVDIDDCCRGILFDMDPTTGAGGVFGGSTMNNLIQNVHIWITQANGSGVEARRPTQWMGRNAFQNVVVHPMKKTGPPAWDASGSVAFRLGDAFLRGCSFVSCACDVYGQPTGVALFLYNGVDELTIIDPQVDPPAATYAPWGNDSNVFTGTAPWYNILGHQGRWRVDWRGNATLAHGTLPANLGVWGATDGNSFAALELNRQDGLRKWQLKHDAVAGSVNNLTLSYYNGTAWAYAWTVQPTTLDFYSAGHLGTKVYAGAPTGTPGNGALAVDDTNHALYFRSGNAWYSASGGAGGGLPPGGTTAQFLRGDVTWSNILDGPFRTRQSGATRYRSDYYVSGGAAIINAYDDTGATYIPINYAGSAHNFTQGGLNVGPSASGAAVGEIRMSGGLYLNNAVNIFAKNAAGTYRGLLQRYSDNRVYLDGHMITFRVNDESSLITGMVLDNSGHLTLAGGGIVLQPAIFSGAGQVSAVRFAIRRDLTDNGNRRNWVIGNEWLNVGDFVFVESASYNTDPNSGTPRFQLLSGGRWAHYYDDPDYATPAMAFYNSNSGGQTPLLFYFNNVLKSGIRSDYVGNFSFSVATGAGYIWWIGGDYPGGTTRMVLNTSGGLNVGGPDPGVPGGAIYATGNIVAKNGGSSAMMGDVGHGATWAAFAHASAFNTTNYAVLAGSAGQTLINAASSQAIGFRIANGGIAFIDANGFTLSGSTQRLNFNATDGSGGSIQRVIANGNLNITAQSQIVLTGNSGGVVCQSGFIPFANGTYSLGISGTAWLDVWCTRGAFNGSLRSLKTDIEPLEPARALALVKATPLYTYRYKSHKPETDPGAWYRHAGYMADEVDRLLAPDGENTTPGTAAALALAAIQELERRLTILEGRTA